MAHTVTGRRTNATTLSEWVAPQLTQLVDAAPDGDQWLHEIKYDGYRMHSRLDHGAVKLLTRTGLDWTHKYPAIARAVASLERVQSPSRTLRKAAEKSNFSRSMPVLGPPRTLCRHDVSCLN